MRKPNPIKYLFLVVLITLATSCGRTETQARKEANTIVGEVNENADLRVLFIGNSHSFPLPKLMGELFERQKPEVTTQFSRVGNFGYLAQHAESPATVESIRNGKWDYVVLQAQKYSTTGKYTYPTDGAMKLSDVAKSAGSKILMYPEWPRKDAPDEYPRIKAIHDSIAEKTGATVAPIGEAWELALAANETLELYDIDGNHASGDGSYLNACVFYALITGESPERADSTKADDESESYPELERAAWDAVAKHLSVAN